MLAIKELHKKFGTVLAVDNVSFSLKQGEITGLLGPNGAGKTTTIRMILGIIQPDAGCVLFNNESIDSIPSKLFGYVPEEKGLYRNSTALENIVFWASLRGYSRKEALDKGMEFLELMGMDSIAGKKIASLSKGQQQIVQIISGIIHQPQVIVFDEPFNGLDPVVQDKFIDILKLLKEQNRIVLLSTHLLQLAAPVCDSFVMLYKGQSAFTGLKSEFFAALPPPKYHIEAEFEYILENLEKWGIDEFNRQNLSYNFSSSNLDVISNMIKDGIIKSLKKLEPVYPSVQEAFIWHLQLKEKKL
ncbi:MAG: ATP-binding cassette domain-containing protein [Ignavibacteria bacterium]|nr:ATP-binding cassette domain-containing protein [Ignavibacteria bacterium]